METMLRMRKFEEHAIEIFSEGLMGGVLHTYIGEEAIAAGVCANLRKDDYVTGTHRGHGHCIAKGSPPFRMMAELMGRKDGCNKGKGGSMHTMDFENGVLGSNGIVGSGIPIATGAALSAKIRGTDQVAVAFFGDGATNRGSFHEALNMAAIWDLPVIFVCEDNKWAISVPREKSTRIQDLSTRASSYGMPGAVVNGNDAMAVYEAAKKAVERARSGGGPTLLVCDTLRQRGHEEGDAQEYRPKDEVARAKEIDPIKIMTKHLIGHGYMTAEQVEALYGKVEAEMADAVARARKSEFPAPEEALDDLFSEVV
ncbi:MAG: thiamine pyrophosphate-dependent dehydrogenase E1 component subunit alpha [Firmicutes bacterium]|nr:thiamine pyrophosphate-dependent dehydrogenase E1 component subunit alpha [Bacillota bacterium]